METVNNADVAWDLFNCGNSSVGRLIISGPIFKSIVLIICKLKYSNMGLPNYQFSYAIAWKSLKSPTIFLN